MAGQLIPGFGAVAGAFGIVGFFLTNFPKPRDYGATVQIKAGLGDGTSDELGGEIVAVHGFDYNNDYLGKSVSGSMGDGGVVELTIDQKVPGVQADYISIQNGKNATCIAWISVRQLDGSSDGAWTGDIGFGCGQKWFMGNQIAGKLKDGGEYRPMCSWLDGDFTNGIENAALKFRTRAYGEDAQATLDSGAGCNSTIFAKDQSPISGRPAKRNVMKREAWMENRLIVSPKYVDHKAELLCLSDTSWGPDFVGSDGMFCDMHSKTLSPLCSTEDVEGCVDIDVAQGTIKKRSTVARRSVSTTHKSYENVLEWK